MLSIDINCDMGEGMPYDDSLMPLISSANIACGGHAGDADTMRRTVELALKNNVVIGAHPSFPDIENFGRKDLTDDLFQLEDLAEVILQQVYKLISICSEFDTHLHHIKPHGALYNRAAIDTRVSGVICSAIKEIDPSLLLYGLSGSNMKREADGWGIKFINEVFADRTYQEDGSLTPRAQPNALIENNEQVRIQVVQLVKEGIVNTINGKSIFVTAETICLHSDGIMAVDFARLISEILKKENIIIEAPGLH